MSRFDRIYKIHDILCNARHPVAMKVFMEELEASRNTITRDFEYLRDSIGAPLEYCREQNGHRYAPGAPSTATALSLELVFAGVLRGG